MCNVKIPRTSIARPISRLLVEGYQGDYNSSSPTQRRPVIVEAYNRVSWEPQEAVNYNCCLSRQINILLRAGAVVARYEEGGLCADVSMSGRRCRVGR